MLVCKLMQMKVIVMSSENNLLFWIYQKRNSYDDKIVNIGIKGSITLEFSSKMKVLHV